MALAPLPVPLPLLVVHGVLQEPTVMLVQPETLPHDRRTEPRDRAEGKLMLRNVPDVGILRRIVLVVQRGARARARSLYRKDLASPRALSSPHTTLFSEIPPDMSSLLSRGLSFSAPSSFRGLHRETFKIQSRRVHAGRHSKTRTLSRPGVIPDVFF